LGQTTRLLDLNPEFYTIWNYRRNILVNGLIPNSYVFFPMIDETDGGRSPDEVVGLLRNELRLTMAYLQIHPKVYWIWNHRKWCLEHVPLGPEAGPATGDAGQEEGQSEAGLKVEKSDNQMTEGWRCGFWKGELAVIEALLDADPRNCMSRPNFRHPPSCNLPLMSEYTDNQSTHGIIGDTSSLPYPRPSPRPVRHLKNWHIHVKRLKAISVISQLGIAGLKFLVVYGRVWIKSRLMRKRIRVSSLCAIWHVRWGRC
jgi:hypothetical protein